MDDKTKIDDIDAKILRILLKEPIATFAEIAKDCETSITTIRNRFNLMKKSGIITGTIMQINPKSVGYDCIAVINIETAPKDRKKVKEFLKDQPIAIYTPYVTGRNSIVGFAIAKDTDDLAQIVNRVKNHENIRSVHTAIWIDMANMDHPENLIIRTDAEQSRKNNCLQPRKKQTFTGAQNNRELNIQKKSTCQLDSVNRSLIKILSKNARISFRKTAKELGISPNSVIKRYKELKETILPFSSITVNLVKLGYVGTGVITIKVAKEQSVKETYKRILQVPNIIVAIKLFGDYDILAVTPFRVFDDLNSITEDISKIPGIHKLDIRIDKPYENWPINIISDLIIDTL